jgi:hypothetical protein
MISKEFTTDYGIVSSTTDIRHNDNGQIELHIVSKLGPATHEHRVTVGAEDGKDLVSSLSEPDLQASLQKHLDEKRADSASILAGRAKVSKISGLLS